MIATVDEVGRVTAENGIDCDYSKGGTLAFARSAVQARAADREVADAHRFGVDPLERRDGSVFDPNCARVHPAKLVRGLARAVERLGATIYEQTTVQGWGPGRVDTSRGVVTADEIVVALEGYGASVRQTHRAVLPLYSLMIATEPLPDATWERMGIAHGQTFTDYRHLLVYGQRTADNRVAFGGRGARYHWGSAIRPQYDRNTRVFEHLAATLAQLFPDASDARVTHRWGGPLGIPRDWHAGVSRDARTRISGAGGYVGDGLSTTNLAGRTLADLILRRDTELTRLPWVGHSSPLWEVEPLRFAGANLGTLAMGIADVEERATGRGSLAARVVAPLTGH